MIQKVNFIKLTLLCLVVFLNFSQITFAQSSVCFEGYSFKTNSVLSANSITNDIVLSWDISNVMNNKQNLNLELEVQPLDDCWNSLEGSIRSKTRLYSMNSTRNDKGEIALKFSDLDAKCFKWRVKLTNSSNNCADVTEWEFSKLVN